MSISTSEMSGVCSSSRIASGPCAPRRPSCRGARAGSTARRCCARRRRRPALSCRRARRCLRAAISSICYLRSGRRETSRCRNERGLIEQPLGRLRERDDAMSRGARSRCSSPSSSCARRRSRTARSRGAALRARSMSSTASMSGSSQREHDAVELLRREQRERRFAAPRHTRAPRRRRTRAP